MFFRYDFHNHSCLSPCGDNDMTPYNFVNMAKLAGLDIVALTDHNTCLNCPAAIKAGEKAGITVIPGMELCTSEEIHVVCLLPDLKIVSEKHNYEFNIPLIKTAVSYVFFSVCKTVIPFCCARIRALSSKAAFSVRIMHAVSARAATPTAFTLPITVSHASPACALDITQLKRSPQ